MLRRTHERMPFALRETLEVKIIYFFLGPSQYATAIDVDLRGTGM